MTSLDVRDMLDLPASAGPRPSKKAKTTGSRPNLKGLQREVQSLGGDNPIAIVPEVPLFKKRRLVNRKPAARWIMKPFKNSARTDELVLHHWRRGTDSESTAAAGSGEGDAVPREEDIDNSIFAKYNVPVNLPKYDNDQYEANLKSDGWTKEETDYLMILAQDFDLRWPVIWDRYDYTPMAPEPSEADAQALIPEPKIRSMEDLKARYYEVASKIMAVHRPVQFMSQAEYTLHSLMSSFDPSQELARKQFAEASMGRSVEDRREEESLLIELKRIMARSEKLNEERKELYARLEAPPSASSGGMYTSSAGLAALLQQLMTVDKSKKRKSVLGPEGGSPAVGGPSGQNSNSIDRRDSNVRENTSGPSGGTGAKKGTMTNASERRQLSKEDEILYGVTHHDRLTGGPVWRHDKASKPIVAKSVQLQGKIANTLTELGIPVPGVYTQRLIMPTAEVVAAFESLLGSVINMLDMKKMTDKLDGEIKVLEAQKAERERRERRDRGEFTPEGDGDVEGGEAGEAEAEVTVKGEEQEEALEPEPEPEPEEKGTLAPSTRAGSVGMHKRSASVLSQISDKSSKRQRK